MKSGKLADATQPAFSWSKLRVEPLRQDVKYVQSEQ